MMTRLLKPYQATLQLTLIERNEPFSLLCCQTSVSQNKRVDAFLPLQSCSRFHHDITTQRTCVHEP
jgi:hypothetical protein